MAFYGDTEMQGFNGTSFGSTMVGKEMAIVSDDVPFFEMIVMTGTFAKYCNANEVFKEKSIVPAKNVFHFEKAGLAVEPVTPNMEMLMLGKQSGQRQLFIQDLHNDPNMRHRYNKKRVVTTTNDINTKIEGRPLTKTRIQKEEQLSRDGYRTLIRSSLKYLLAEVNGLLPKGGTSWEELTADLDKMRAFEKEVDTYFESGKEYILPIDFQSVDAFEVLDVDAPGYRAPKLKQVGPAVIVSHRSYALLKFAVDADGRMSTFDRAIEHYLWTTTESVDKKKYSLDRCPLAIYWAEIFNSMTLMGMDITLSVAGHKECSVELAQRYKDESHSYAKGEVGIHEVGKSVDEIRESLERKQDGFSQESFELAMDVFRREAPSVTDRIVTITCKPGEKPVYKRRSIAGRGEKW